TVVLTRGDGPARAARAVGPARRLSQGRRPRGRAGLQLRRDRAARRLPGRHDSQPPASRKTTFAAKPAQNPEPGRDRRAAGKRGATAEAALYAGRQCLRSGEITASDSTVPRMPPCRKQGEGRSEGGIVGTD